MSAGDPAAAVEAGVQSVLQALRQDRRPAASQQLFQTILLAQQGAPGAARAVQLARLGRLGLQAGFEDLGLVALVAAVAGFVAAQDPGSAESAMLDVGGAYTRLLSMDDAVHWNQCALDLALAHGHHANAASASTNLALCALQAGDPAGAEARAIASLASLSRAPFPHTEAVTRALLALLADRLDWPAEEAIGMARPLFADASLRDVENGEALRGQAAQALDHLVARHLASHPVIDAAAWKGRLLPELWGGAA